VAAKGRRAAADAAAEARRRRAARESAAADEFVFPSAPTHTPVFTGSPRVAVAALAAGAAHDRAQRLAGINVGEMLAEHAAREGRSRRTGGTRRRRRTRRRRKRRRSRRKR